MSQIEEILHDKPELLTITETAEILRVTPLTLKRWEKKGKIKPIRINSRGDRRYPKDEILKILTTGNQVPIVEMNAPETLPEPIQEETVVATAEITNTVLTSQKTEEETPIEAESTSMKPIIPTEEDKTTGFDEEEDEYFSFLKE